MNSIYKNKILQNLLAWLIIYIVIISAENDNNLIIGAVVLLFIAPPVYINNILILPYYSNRRKTFYTLFILNLIVSTAIVSGCLFLFLDISVDSRTINTISVLFLSIIVGSALKLTRDNLDIKQKNEETELKLLKGQLNPHFLFNTLNNLYGLSVAKSDKLPSLMLKLSELLRYSIYETKEIYVALKKEIDYLENYIALEIIRLEDEADIHFNKSKISENRELKIAPMLLIVFVENAFKHLCGSDEKEMIVHIDIKVEGNILEFNCINNYSPQKTINEIEIENGIGLKNVLKRLNLIYPNQYKYEVDKSENSYNVKLSLPLI